mgnify:CR=1 FL=1
MKKLLICRGKEHTGVVHHRMLAPLNRLGINHKDEFHLTEAILNNDQLLNEPEDVLKRFDGVLLQRLISTQGNVKAICDRLRGLGIKIIFDIDDYWELPHTHPYHGDYKKFDIPQQVRDALTYSDLVTVSTEELYHHVKPHNPNVEILPNCLDPDESQWRQRNIDAPRLRFGWIGGSFHWNDISAYKDDFKGLDRNYRQKIQVVFGGFNPQSQECMYIEAVFTNEYKHVSTDYKDYLLNGDGALEHVALNQPYRRLRNETIGRYGFLFDSVDVVLALLPRNDFNDSKSNLKILEAGMKKKAIICSDVPAYNNDMCKAIQYCKPGNLAQTMKSINKDRAKDLGEELHEYVGRAYNIDKITEKRKQVYLSLW